MDEDIKESWNKAILCCDCQFADCSSSVTCAYRCNNPKSPCRNRTTMSDFGCTYGEPKNKP